MERKKVTIEYPLAAKSPAIVWRLISSAAGLQKWMADRVSDDGATMTFTWGESWRAHDVKVSHVISSRKFSYLRLRWEADHGEDEYWEMRISQSEHTGSLALVITDFADADEEDSIRCLWSGNLSRLHSVSGL